MLIKNKKSLSKKTIILAVTTVVIICGLGAYWVLAVNNTNNKEPYTAPTKEQVEAGEKTQQDADDKTNAPLVDNPTEDSPQKSMIDSYITAMNQTDSELQVRTNINALISSGSCTLQLSKSGQSSVKEVSDIAPFATTSTCRGFNIPLSKLSKGTWVIDLAVDSNSYTSSARSSVEIK